MPEFLFTRLACSGHLWCTSEGEVRRRTNTEPGAVATGSRLITNLATKYRAFMWLCMSQRDAVATAHGSDVELLIAEGNCSATFSLPASKWIPDETARLQSSSRDDAVP
jgi:hypothetical protein